MRRIRVIPVLLIESRKLIKTIRFKSPYYVGDPMNALRIFNEKEVDEIVVLDRGASHENRGPDLDFIKLLTSECFMPSSYGGGITTIQQAHQLFHAGVEKIIIGAAAFRTPELITELAKTFGTQSIVVSLDVKPDLWRRPRAYISNGRNKVADDPVAAAKRFESLGAGEIILQMIDSDGMQKGYDLSILRKICSAVTIPVVALGGARSIDDFFSAATEGASAVAAGSMFMFRGPHKAVLINYPSQVDLMENLYARL